MVMGKAALIKDEAIRKFYLRDLKQKEYDLFRRKRKKPAPRMSVITPTSSTVEKMEKILLATLINHPNILDIVIEKFVAIDFQSKQMVILKKKLLEAYEGFFLEKEMASYVAAVEKLAQDFENVFCGIEVHAGFSCRNATPEEATSGWLSVCEKYCALICTNADLQNASNRLQFTFSYNDWQRLKALKEEVLTN
jgi:hypothetical protein